MSERSDPPPNPPDPLDDAWARVQEAWEDVERHEQALVIADTLDRLGELGARYRKVREAGGPQAVLAERFSQQVVARALGRLVSAPRHPQGRSPIEWAMMGVSIALIAAALWSMLRTFG